MITFVSGNYNKADKLYVPKNSINRYIILFNTCNYHDTKINA